MTANAHSLDQLLEIMRRLRDPENGCAWDIKQNFQSIAPFTIEEAYEVADAIERDDMDDLQDELGDFAISGRLPCADGRGAVRVYL